MLQWEDISHDNGFHLRRGRVFGGWLVSAISDVQTSCDEGYDKPINREGIEWRTSITFVPDMNKEWKL